MTTPASSDKDQISASIVRARAELEHALTSLEKLPALDHKVVGFTAHALNNYLHLTGGTVDLLRQSLADHPDPQINTWLDGLQHVTTLMTHTVSQLMCTAVSAETQFRFEQVDLGLLVSRVCAFYQRVATRKQITITQSVLPGLPPVWTDRVAVAAVLDNLLSNAVKYSPGGGRVGVDLHADADGVVCQVRDEGPGLSAAEQRRLFEPGVKLSPRPTAGEPTTGYGLAVAKELSDKIGAQIWCRSDRGQGSCFAFRVPRYNAEIHGQKAAAPVSAAAPVPHSTQQAR
jgi:signal transduction histidine kinase